MEAFSYSVSHDLRTPLRALAGYSKELLHHLGDQLDEQDRHDLNRIRAASVRMGELIDDLLDLSRITRMEMIKEDVNLSDLAEKIVQEFRNDRPERKWEFVSAPGLIVKGDPKLVRVALENLLGNAWKFTEKRPVAKIELGATTHEGQNAYFVRDNGAGFDMAYAGKLFGAFQRLHDADEFPGTGIGLATVQRIIRRHGGMIWAEAKVDDGATFYFTLPS
jgi:light-regulated signal transduction histidine kinase (bacteriophytochrome)